jgi:hypothetical protein
MIYTAPCVTFLMRADTLRGKVGGGWALEIESILGPVKWHRADRRVGGIGYFFLFPHNAIFKPTDLAVVGFLPRQILIPLRNRGYAISQF